MIKRFFQYLYKLYQWHKYALTHDYDFDNHGLYIIIAYKLKRLEYWLINGVAEHSKDSIKAIRIAIALCNKLHKDEYDIRAWERHQQKWGKHEYWTTPEQSGLTCRYYSRYTKAVFEKDIKSSKQEYFLNQQIANKCFERDKRNLFNILNKYITDWWD